MRGVMVLNLGLPILEKMYYNVFEHSVQSRIKEARQ